MMNATCLRIRWRTVEHKPKRGGPNRGQGRPPVKAGEETITMCLRMTLRQREKLARLGGAAFVRKQIDEANTC